MATKKMLCPLMQRECIEDGAIINNELVACKFWVQVQGKHPQTGEVINHHDCTLCWTPILLIENSKVNRETGAAIESFRNETMAMNRGALFQNVMQSVAQRQPPSSVLPDDTPTISTD